MAQTDLSELYKGLQIAKGDQLVDVLHIWDYRARKDFDRRDYDRILGYSVNLVPAIAAIIENNETDVELRAIAAGILVNFVLILDKIIDSGDIAPAQIDVIRKKAVAGLLLCFSYPISISGKLIIAKAAKDFRETDGVKSLRVAIINDESMKSRVEEGPQ